MNNVKNLRNAEMEKCEKCDEWCFPDDLEFAKDSVTLICFDCHIDECPDEFSQDE
jgi:hypothetical protein